VKLAGQGAACVFVIILLGACSPAAPKAAAPLPEDVLSQGQGIYEQLCATCHFDGHGSPTAPSLADSLIVKNSPDKMITQILHGSRGMFKTNTGQEIQGIMPPQDSLSNEDIAAVVTYVRHQFGSVDQLTTPAEVAAKR
jgi:mono/diheme cytochrome c family protein